MGGAYDDSVVPGKDDQLIKSGNQIPTGSDVARYEDRKGEDRKRVHESPSTTAASLLCPWYILVKLYVGSWKLVLYRELQGFVQSSFSGAVDRPNWR